MPTVSFPKDAACNFEGTMSKQSALILGLSVIFDFHWVPWDCLTICSSCVYVSVLGLTVIL